MGRQNFVVAVSMKSSNPADSDLSSTSWEHVDKVQSLPVVSGEGLDSIYQVPSHNQFGEEKEINIAGEIPLP